MVPTLKGLMVYLGHQKKWRFTLKISFSNIMHPWNCEYINGVPSLLFIYFFVLLLIFPWASNYLCFTLSVFLSSPTYKVLFVVSVLLIFLPLLFSFTARTTQMTIETISAHVKHAPLLAHVYYLINRFKYCLLPVSEHVFPAFLAGIY